MARKNDRFLGKSLVYKGATIKVSENLGLCYEDDACVYYACLVTKGSDDLPRKGAKVELRYQQLRTLKELVSGKPRKQRQRAA